MPTFARLRDLPLRQKLAVTILGAAVLVLGVSSYLSYRFWREQAVFFGEQNALLAAGSARGAVEAALQDGDTYLARRALRELRRSAPVTSAYVLGSDGTIVAALDQREEGRRLSAIWIPRVKEIPPAGATHRSADRIRVTLPLATAPRAAVLLIEFSKAPLEEAVDRGGRLGLGLLVGSLFAVIAIVLIMLEREVVAPVRRVSRMLIGQMGVAREDELGRIAASVEELIEKGQEAQRITEEHARELEERAGLAQVGELAAEMAHELKRPLATVRTALELLEEEYVLDPKGQQLLGAVDGQLEKLSETLRDLFTLAQPSTMAAERIAPRALLDTAVMQLSGHPAAKQIVIVREYSDAPEIHGDRRRIEHAVLNLMLNAAEAMPDGGTLTVRLGAASGAARIDIVDTGVGIPPEKIEQVLRPFYSTKPLGTGLGLPLVARVVAAHGGELSIDSAPGAGTTVRIVLPVNEPAPNPEEPCPTHAFSS